MPYHRNHSEIQRLLSNEYSDLADTVLIESSFVETTRKGANLQQLQIGKTIVLELWLQSC